MHRRVDEQLQQIAELKSLLDGLKVTSQDNAAYDQVDNEIKRLTVQLESTQNVVDARSKEVLADVLTYLYFDLPSAPIIAIFGKKFTQSVVSEISTSRDARRIFDNFSNG